MVYANLVWTYEISRKDDKNIGSYSRDVGYWQAGDRKEYGMMQPEDKANLDRQADLKDWRSLREQDELYSGFEEIKDDIWYY